MLFINAISPRDGFFLLLNMPQSVEDLGFLSCLALPQTPIILQFAGYYEYFTLD